jgi:probable rRNA maturation factor
LIILNRQVDGLNAEALGRFVARARRAVSLQGKVNILVTSSAEMRTLNLRFRKKNKTTDVLSFPLDSNPAAAATRRFAGEIAISADIASRNAARLGHPASVEVKILALHGILHLAGFDHERDNGKMARKERKLRRELGLPSSLTERESDTGRYIRSDSLQRSAKARKTA